MNIKSNSMFDESLLEGIIRNVLAAKKFLFPTNETELADLIKEIEKESDKLPSALNDVSRIFRPSGRRYSANANVPFNDDFSLAARHGGKISQEQVEKILSKIKTNLS